MKYFILASTVVVLVFFTSIGVVQAGSLTGDTDNLQSVSVDSSLVLFMPAVNQIVTDIVETYEGGC